MFGNTELDFVVLHSMVFVDRRFWVKSSMKKDEDAAVWCLTCFRNVSLAVVQITSDFCPFTQHVVHSVFSPPKSAFKLCSSNIFCPVRAHCLHASTFARLQQDGAFLSSCGDFVTQSCCPGNMSHLIWTWVGICLKPNCVFPAGKERLSLILTTVLAEL